MSDKKRNIHRVEKNSNYVVMNRTALNDEKLSWKAKGIMAYMLSMPDDWTFYITELVSHATDGEKSFRSGFNELRDSGYVKRVPIYEGNKISHWETVVYEIPQTLDVTLHSQNVHVQKVDVQNVHVQKDALLSTDVLPSNDLSLSIEDIVEIVSYLNDVAGKKYKHTTSKTKTLIGARIKEGFTIDDFKKVIDTKTSEWKNDSKMSKFLRPDTLFGTKFEGYLNQETKTTGYDPNRDAF